MKETRFKGVYEKIIGRKRFLYTKNLAPGKDVYGERLIRENSVEYREWNISKSKLAAAIIKNISQIGIKENEVVLYLGAASGTTVSHVSDIVGKKGFIFAVDFAPRVVRDLVFVCEERKNIAPILADANKPLGYVEFISLVDCIYQDIAQKNQVDIFLKNCKLFLKNKGIALLCIKARSIDITKRPNEIFKETIKELEKELTILDYKILEPFQKDHCFFVCQKNKF